jgi:hypothetical protein
MIPVSLPHALITMSSHQWAEKAQEIETIAREAERARIQKILGVTPNWQLNTEAQTMSNDALMNLVKARNLADELRARISETLRLLACNSLEQASREATELAADARRLTSEVERIADWAET